MKDFILHALKNTYLFLVRLRSKRVSVDSKQIVFLLSFPETSCWLLDKLAEEVGTKLVICSTENGKETVKAFQNKGYKIYNMDSFYQLIKNIVPLINRSSLVICDNYFPFLAGIPLSQNRKVVQIWHANGAIKSFGLEAKYAKRESEQDKKRYIEVYQRFTHIIVSSQKMAEIFEKNFQKKFETLPFGYPLTDLYFDQSWIAKSKIKLKKTFPSEKKTLLYVPTYRENNQENPLDFTKLSDKLGDEWQILAKAHPHDQSLQNKLQKEKGIITDFKTISLNELYPFVDCLVTDYSSTIFEYTLANPSGKIVFFCYDIKEYRETVGIEPDFEEWAPGKIVTNENDLIQAINEPRSQSFAAFNQMWNEYAQGTSVKQLLEWMDKDEGH